MPTDLTFLAVPEAEYPLVKALGGIWDDASGAWCVPAGESLDRFSRWVVATPPAPAPSVADSGADAAPEEPNRTTPPPEPVDLVTGPPPETTMKLGTETAEPHGGRWRFPEEAFADLPTFVPGKPPVVGGEDRERFTDPSSPLAQAPASQGLAPVVDPAPVVATPTPAPVSPTAPAPPAPGTAAPTPISPPAAASTPVAPPAPVSAPAPAAAAPTAPAPAPISPPASAAPVAPPPAVAPSQVVEVPPAPVEAAPANVAPPVAPDVPVHDATAAPAAAPPEAVVAPPEAVAVIAEPEAIAAPDAPDLTPAGDEAAMGFDFDDLDDDLDDMPRSLNELAILGMADEDLFAEPELDLEPEPPLVPVVDEVGVAGSESPAPTPEVAPEAAQAVIPEAAPVTETEPVVAASPEPASEPLPPPVEVAPEPQAAQLGAVPPPPVPPEPATSQAEVPVSDPGPPPPATPAAAEPAAVPPPPPAPPLDEPPLMPAQPEPAAQTEPAAAPPPPPPAAPMPEPAYSATPIAPAAPTPPPVDEAATAPPPPVPPIEGDVQRVTSEEFNPFGQGITPDDEDWDDSLAHTARHLDYPPTAQPVARPEASPGPRVPVAVIGMRKRCYRCGEETTVICGIGIERSDEGRRRRRRQEDEPRWRYIPLHFVAMRLSAVLSPDWYRLVGAGAITYRMSPEDAAAGSTQGVWANGCAVCDALLHDGAIQDALEEALGPERDYGRFVVDTITFPEADLPTMTVVPLEGGIGFG